MIRQFLQRKIVRDASWYTVANAIVQISSLIGVLFVSRYLGPTNLGLYAFVQNVTAVFVTVLASMDIYANWHIVSNTEKEKELSIYTYQKLYIAIMLCIILGVFSFLFLPRDVSILTLSLCIPILTSVFSSYIFIAQHKSNARLVAVGIGASALLLLILKLGAVFAGSSLQYFVIINSLDGILLTLLCVLAYKKQEGQAFFRYKPKKQDFIHLAQGSFFPLLYLLFWFVVVRLDQFLVPLYFNAFSLGVYSSAVKVIEMTNVIIVIMQALIIPRIVQINNPETGLRSMHIAIALYLCAGLGTAVAIFVLAPFVVEILFGQDFIQTVSILRVYAWSIPGLFVSYLFSVVFMSQKNFKLLALHAAFFAIVTSTLLMFVFIKKGIVATASVSIIVYTASACVYYILWRYKKY
jgi:O-antigen/teichoic acid export membrane protein